MQASTGCLAVSGQGSGQAPATHPERGKASPIMPPSPVAARPAAPASGPVYACHGSMSSFPGPCPTCGQPMQPVSGAAGTGSLAATARQALTAAGIPEASAVPASGAAGFLAVPLRAVGPDRVAVTWREPGVPQPPRPRLGPGLARCRAVLDASGYRSEYVIADDGGYLAVLAPAGA
jgi:hypothetical protein